MSPIFYDAWKSLGELWESGFDRPQSGILYVTTDHIAEFFKEFPNFNGTIISGASDFSICLQKAYSPALHMRRWMQMSNIDGIGYTDLLIPARMNKEKCLADDKYSVRMYSWMGSTFNKIPKCRWFCTNVNIVHPSIIPIPFGTSEKSYELVQKYKHLPKKDEVFVCFSSTSNERHGLKQTLKNVPGFNVYIDLEEEEYYKLFCQHKYVLCPIGNGLLCYREYDAWMSGCIPVFIGSEIGEWCRAYKDLPRAILADNLKIRMFSDATNLNVLDFNYWKDRIYV